MGNFTSDEASSPQRLVTVAEACLLLSISRSKIYSLIQAGELERIKIGRCARIPMRSIQKFSDPDRR